jgi:hypothetical protein
VEWCCNVDISVAGFDKYKGGLDTVHYLTGLYSVYTNWRSIEIMFHVSTLLPYEKRDPQQVTRPCGNYHFFPYIFPRLLSIIVTALM